MSDPAIRSPCIGVCELDVTGYCRGCRRTLAEIAGWLGFSADARDAIIAELDRRVPPARADGLEE
jgi:uncharacterized protein